MARYTMLVMHLAVLVSALIPGSQQEDLLDSINGLVNTISNVVSTDGAQQRPPSYKELEGFRCPKCDIIDCNLAFDPTCRLAWKYMAENETVRFQISLRNPTNQIWLAIGFNKFKQMIGTNVVVMLLGKENFDIYNGYLSNYGPPLKESESLANVQVKTQYNRIIIVFERSVKFLSTFSGNLYDLSECNNIVVGSGSHAYEGFFFHANVPRFTETCYKVAAPPPEQPVPTSQSSSEAPNEKTSESTTPTPTSSTRAPSEVKKTTKPNSHVPGPNLKPRPINGLARTFKFQVQVSIFMQFIDDYYSNKTDAYMKLDEKIRKYMMDSLGSGYVKSRIESLRPGSVVATMILEYKDDAKRSVSDIMEDIWFKLLFGDPTLLSINPTTLIISDLNQPANSPSVPSPYFSRRISPLVIILPILSAVFFVALGLIVFFVYKSNRQKRRAVQPTDLSKQTGANTAGQCDPKSQVNTVSAGMNSPPFNQSGSPGAQHKANMAQTLKEGESQVDLSPSSPELSEVGGMSRSGSYLIKSGSTSRSKKYNTVKVDESKQAASNKVDSFKSKSFSNFPKNDYSDPNHIYENDYEN